MNGIAKKKWTSRGEKVKIAKIAGYIRGARRVDKQTHTQSAQGARRQRVWQRARRAVWMIPSVPCSTFVAEEQEVGGGSV